MNDDGKVWRLSGIFTDYETEMVWFGEKNYIAIYYIVSFKLFLSYFQNKTNKKSIRIKQNNWDHLTYYKSSDKKKNKKEKLINEFIKMTELAMVTIYIFVSSSNHIWPG